MLPKVNRSVLIERKAVNYVSTILTEWGWIVQELDRDFGEDLYVKIPIEGEIGTYNAFKIQVKGTTAPRLLTNGKLSYSFDLDHLIHWTKLENPLLLCVVDVSESDPTGYWIIVDESIEEMMSESTNEKTLTIKFSNRNILSLSYSMHKISVAIFWFYQDGYDISTRKGKKVKQIVEENIEYLLREVPDYLYFETDDKQYFLWDEILNEFNDLLWWLDKHGITDHPPEWMIAHANLYYFSNNPSETINILDRLLLKEISGEMENIAQWNKAMALIDIRQHDESIEILTKHLVNNSKSSIIWCHLGIIYRRTCEYDKAIKCHNTAIQLNMDELDSYASLAGCHRDLNDFKTAEIILEKALLINEDHFPNKIALAALKKDMKKYRESENIYKSLLPEFHLNTPDSLVIQIGYASVLRKLGNFEKSLQMYLHVISINKNNIYALNGYGWLLIDMGDFELAKKVFEKVLKLDPNDKIAISGLKRSMKK